MGRPITCANEREKEAEPLSPNVSFVSDSPYLLSFSLPLFPSSSSPPLPASSVGICLFRSMFREESGLLETCFL